MMVELPPPVESSLEHGLQRFGMYRVGLGASRLVVLRGTPGYLGRQHGLLQRFLKRGKRITDATITLRLHPDSRSVTAWFQ